MKWIDRLEKRFGFLAIHGLLRYVAACNGVVFLLYKWDPRYLTLIDLDPRAVLHGEVWRLVTYLFIPQMGSFPLPAPDWFNAAFFIFFLIWVGDRLEQVWGAFKLNLFYLLGMIGTTIAAFFFGAMFSNSMLNSSLFFAFAHFFPDVVIFFAYILPLKVKWIAWFYAAFLFFQLLVGSMAARAAIIAAFSNYLIFFGPELFHQARHRREVSTRRRRFEADTRDVAEPLHKCASCGATESQTRQCPPRPGIRTKGGPSPSNS